jgi:hypothetical protein
MVVLAALFTAVARQSWAASGSATNQVDLESGGAQMMHGMTGLLSQLVAAQSAAVRGQPVDQAGVNSALTALNQPAGEYGATLQTGQRLADLTNQIQAAFNAKPTGRTAYQTYSSIVDLALALDRVIGDSSGMIHDPDLDSYYLIDAALVRLPDAMVYAGRAADLVALAGASGVLTGDDAVRAAVARFKVSDDAEQVSAGLTTSVASTNRSVLGANIAPRLDDFRGAADQFSPPTMLQELALPVDAATMADNASRVFTRATSLAHLLLFELQALLTERDSSVAQQRRFTVIAGAAAGLCVVAAVWLVLVLTLRRPRRRAGGEEPGTNARGFVTVTRGGGSGAGGGSPAARGTAAARAAAGLGITRSSAPAGPGDLADVGARRSGNAQ